MNRTTIVIAMALGLLTGPAGAYGQMIDREVIAGGGGAMTAGGFHIDGTVSQTADILAAAGGLQAAQGFWYQAGARSQLAVAVGGLQWHVIAGGGAQDAQNALYKLSGTLSQTAEGVIAAAGFELGQGFWYGDPEIPLYKIRQEEDTDADDGGSDNQFVAGESHAGSRATMNIAPNPVAGYARITVRLPRPGQVRIVIYDERGDAIGTAFEGSLAAGEEEVRFDGSQIPAGAYFVRMQLEEEVVTRKITIIR